MAHFTALPVELIEYILVLSLFSERQARKDSIFTALKGHSSESITLRAGATPSPTSLSSLSQTCRHFYGLIYQSGNTHLWHSLFLASFDDPMALVSWHSSLGREEWIGQAKKPLESVEGPRMGADGKESQGGDAEMDWKAEFIRRMSTRKILSQLQTYHPKHPLPDPSDTPPFADIPPHPWDHVRPQPPIIPREQPPKPSRRRVIEALHTIRDSLRTLSPIAHSPLPFDTSSTSLGQIDTELTGAHTVWAPFTTFFSSVPGDHQAPVTLQSIPNGFDPARSSVSSSFPSAPERSEPGGSKTVTWVEDVLLDSGLHYPRYLLEEYIASQEPHRVELKKMLREREQAKGKGKEKQEDEDEEELEELERKLFAEILFLRGMGPIPTCPPPSSSDASSPSCLTPINGLDTDAHPGPKLPSGATLPPPSLPGPSTPEGEDAGSDADADLTLDEIFPPELQPPEDDPSSYLTTARRQARLKVYDLDYLMKERMWGPWEVIPKYAEEVKERQRKREHRSRIYAERMREVSDRANVLNGVATDDGATEGAMERDDEAEDDIDADDGDWMPDVLAYGEGGLYEELVLNDDDEDFHYEEIDEGDEDDEGIPHASDVFVLAEEDDDEPAGSGMSSPLSTGSGPPTVNGNNHNNPHGVPSRNLIQDEVEEHQHLLVPDYTFLAAARLIIETNLREHYHAVSAFHGGFGGVGIDANGSSMGSGSNADAPTLDWPTTGGLGFEMERAGSAVGYAGVKRPRSEDEDEENEGDAGVVKSGVDVKGKGKQVNGEAEWDGEGWDWAGVEGEWRRCVCFLDYRDLMMFNTQRRIRHGLTNLIDIEPMDEAVRIVPMTLKVKRYLPPAKRRSFSSASSTPPTSISEQVQNTFTDLAYTLPVIEFEGVSRGSDLSPTESRRVTGSVRMLECGAVRWSVCTHSPENGLPEWASENVQIGGIGSAMGFIGLWTGADHETSDPLGPIWSWKISGS